MLIRQADVTGPITLGIPALGTDATTDLVGVPGDIRTALSNCGAPHRPARGRGSGRAAAPVARRPATG